jgi:hypothetical protein
VDVFEPTYTRGNWFPESQSYFTTDCLPSISSSWRQAPRGQSYVTTDSQSASLSLCQASIWGLRPDFCYCQTVAGLLMWGALCLLQLLLVLASAVILGFESCGTRDHILLSQIRDSPNLEGQVLVLISPRNRVAQLYPQALGSLFVAFYDLQGYGGGIRTRLHAGSLSRLHRLTTYIATARTA